MLCLPLAGPLIAADGFKISPGAPLAARGDTILGKADGISGKGRVPCGCGRA